MQKAIIVTPYAEPEKGACTIRVNFFKDSLIDAGFAVEVLAPKRESTPELPGFRRVSSKIDMAFRIISRKPYLVLGVSPPLQPNVFALSASKICGAKFILDAKEDPLYIAPKTDSLQAKLKNLIFLISRKFVYILSDKLLFLTKSDLNSAATDYSLPESKLVLLMNGTDTKKVRFDKLQRDYVRKKFGISESELVLVYGGSTGDEEVEQFLESVRHLAESNQLRIILVLAYEENKASKRQFDNLVARIEQLGIERKVACISNIDYSEMYKYLSAADVGIIPWPNELVTSIPVKLFDYSAAGLFILAKAPEKSELSEFIRKNTLGISVSGWHGFSLEVEKMLKSRKSISVFRESNRKKAQSMFDRSMQAIKFKSIIERLMSYTGMNPEKPPAK